ncbi:MAG: acyltransferase family protein [Rickettsiales bacterium]
MVSKVGERVYFLDYVKTIIIVLIVAHHASLAYSLSQGYGHNYVYSAAQILDKNKLFIFDYFESFNDIYFMPLMFLVSGFFVMKSLKKKGAMSYMSSRFNRLLVPFIFSITILMPLSYYPVGLLKNSNLTLMEYVSKDYIMNFYRVPGPIWFLLALFMFDLIAAMAYKLCPKAVNNLLGKIENTGKINFLLTFLSTTTLVFFLSYIFIPSDNVAAMSKLGPIWFQKKRSLLYFCFFAFGFLAGGTKKFSNLVTRDNHFLVDTWLFRIIISIMLFGLFRYYREFMAKSQPDYLSDFLYCTLFVFLAAMVSSAWIATVGKFANRKSRFLSSLSEQSFGIFIFHFIIIVWMQYLLVNIKLGASQKFYIVFSLSLFSSWLITLVLKRIPVVKRFL